KVDGWIAQAKLDQVQIKKKVEEAKKNADPKWGPTPMYNRPGGATDPQQAAAQEALKDQKNTRKATNPDPKDPSGRAAMRGLPAETDPSRTQMTADQMKEKGMGLSKREMEAQGNPGGGEALKWSEGVKVWAMDAEHGWTAAQKALKIPLGAGPSGT